VSYGLGELERQLGHNQKARAAYEEAVQLFRGLGITTYAFSQIGLRKSGPCGAVCSWRQGACNLPSMTDGLSTLYQDLLAVATIASIALF